MGEWVEEGIEGGFRAISVVTLGMAWWLHLAGHLARRDLRVWFACHELEARRCQLAPDEPRRYSVEEIQRLVGGAGGDHVRASLRKLEAVGLLLARKGELRFSTSPDQLAVEDTAPLFDFLRELPNRRRSVPIPRRLVRELAAGFSRATTATILAHLIRCVFWHKEQGAFRVDGRAKASWIARTFGVCERAVVQARGKLVELGWLKVVPASQWELNRWGCRVVIDLAWRRGEAAEARGSVSESAPPPSASAPGSAPPDSNQNLSFGEYKNQNPAPPRPSRSGVCKANEEKQTQAPPSLDNVTHGDLESFERLEKLHQQAVVRELASDSEWGILQFVSLAERARAHGHEPCRLFSWLLRNQRFEFITLADEEAAQERIKRARNGPVVNDRDGGGVADLLGSMFEPARGNSSRDYTSYNRLQELRRQVQELRRP